MNTLQLQPRLKRLKLGGMLQTLELRLDQAHQEKLGHLAFLELMLEDEIQRRQKGPGPADPAGALRGRAHALGL